MRQMQCDFNEKMLVNVARSATRQDMSRLWGFCEKTWADCERMRAGTISSGTFLQKAHIRKILQRSSNARVLAELDLAESDDWEQVALPVPSIAQEEEVAMLEEAICAQVHRLSISEKRFVYRMIQNL